MANVIVIGTQWGDEGKGKLVDLLSQQADLVVRFQGGNNAGHTVMYGDKTFILHLVPSGILHDNKKCVIGNGLVVDVGELLKELRGLESMGVTSLGRLFISESATLIMPYHKVLDKAGEEKLKNRKIGTTGRGIGPAYIDKVGRIGIRFADIEDSPEFKEKLEQIVDEKNLVLRHVLNYQGDLLNSNEIYAELLEHHRQIAPYLCDVSELIDREMAAGNNVLFEGAQGTFLDVDHGTYPFVTSSNTVSANACTGSGVGPTKIDKVVGVVKAYTTRVGEGPFPTELFDEVGELLAKEGAEFGATTGRSRRCGWFDACLLKKAIRVNGLTHLAVTKLDVLDKLETIKICIAYEDGQGNRYDNLPGKQALQKEIKPVYEEIEGWQSKSSGATEMEALPEKAKSYIKRLEEILEVPVFIISTGPKREETIVLENIFSD